MFRALMVDVRPAEPPNEEDAMTATAMPSTHQGSGRRHRVVAIGSGLGELTATKALKHDLVNIADALVYLTRMTGQGTSHVVNRTSLWVQVIPATAAAFNHYWRAHRAIHRHCAWVEKGCSRTQKPPHTDGCTL